MPEPSRVYLFWDNSNIYISAKMVAEQRDGFTVRGHVRIAFDNLFKLAVAGRPVAKAIAVGSIPPEQQTLWDKLKADTGVQVELYERGEATGHEQGLDQCLQVHMLRALADNDTPQIAVLLTGDGKGYDDGVGFHADLKRMSDRGWGIEVISWDLSCRGALKTWASDVGVYIKLEDYYDPVTFIEGIRRMQPLSLTHRPLASVRSVATEPVPDSAALEDARQELQKVKRKNQRAEDEGKRATEALAKRDEQIRQLEAQVRNSRNPSHVKKRIRQAKKRTRKASR